MLKLHSFNSISEFVNYIETTPLNDVFRWEQLHSSRRLIHGFNLTGSYNEAKKLLEHGWTSMAKRLEGQLKAMASEIEYATTRRSIYDVAGFQASVPRYLQGIPTNMINQKVVMKKQKVITLVKSFGYHAGVSTDEIVEHSLKALQIIRKVESQGYRVNLDIVSAAESPDCNEKVGVKIRIKSANEKLNISKLAFPLIHPDMLRRLKFRFTEVCPDVTSKTWKGGYGRPIYNEEVLRPHLGPNAYFLPSFIDDVDQTLKRLNFA